MCIDLLFARRSIREYTPERVSEEAVEQMLRAAMAAPSAGNQQPWHFVVIRDSKTLSEIPKIHQYALMCANATVAILVCGDESKEMHKGYWVQDCSAATQNMLLAAQSLGLGAVWVGIYPRTERVESLRRLLTIPESIVPFSIVPCGFPVRRKEPSHRFDLTRVHYESWLGRNT